MSINNKREGKNHIFLRGVKTRINRSTKRFLHAAALKNMRDVVSVKSINRVFESQQIVGLDFVRIFICIFNRPALLLESGQKTKNIKIVVILNQNIR